MVYEYYPPSIPWLKDEQPVVTEYVTMNAQMARCSKQSPIHLQSRMKVQVDKRQVSANSLSVTLYLKFQPYKMTTSAVRFSIKLEAKYYGPYCVLAN